MRRRWLWWWLIGYALILSVIVTGAYQARKKVLAEYSTPESIADWQSWREDVRRGQTNPGPVERKVPKSEEPPALVLMRDYFTISLLGATFFSSLLYWIVAWFVAGATQTKN